jgi:hypothetical protein
VKETLESIVRLRRVSRVCQGSIREDIEATLSHLERMAGPTVKRAEAARLLRVSQTALDRWVKKGDIPVVLTPLGRREIPRSQLVELMESLQEHADEGPYALSRVIQERRRAAKAIDENDFLPRRQRPRTHRVPDLHALAYHRVVAQRLDESLVREAHKRLERWKETGKVDTHWAEEWERVLSLPLTRIAKTISSDSERGRALRQSSPFAGSLTEHERQRIARAVETRVGS